MSAVDSSDERHYAVTRDTFETWASEVDGYYDTRPGEAPSHSRWQRMVRRLVHAVWDRDRSGPAPLALADCGCGRGDLAIEIVDRAPAESRVVGFDFSPTMLAIAARIAGARNAEWREADLRSLPASDAEFDVTFCINVLHHVHPRDRDRVLDELGRVTRSTLVLEIKNAANPWYRWFYAREIGGAAPVHPMRVGELAAALQRAGFAITDRRGVFGPLIASPLVVVRAERVAWPGGRRAV